MNPTKLAGAVYRDVEKLYRLIGVYSGDLRQMEKQVEFIDKNLEKNLREPLRQGGVMEFDLLMTAVYFDGEEVFVSKTPEFTLAHALFCEGLKSISLRQSLSAQELIDWMMVVRNILISKDQSSDEEQSDLASVLWRKNSPNIQISLYNQLMMMESSNRDLTKFNVDLDTDAFEAQFIREALRSEEQGAQAITQFKRDDQAESQLDTSWITRDERWEIPQGDQLIQRLGALGKRDPEMIQKLRMELADASISDRARKIVRFQAGELDRVRREMEHLDQTQLDYNSLAHSIYILEASDESDTDVAKMAVDDFKKTVQSIVGRFHVGLVLFVLKKVRKWKTKDRYKSLYEKIDQDLRGFLSTPENLKNIALAFGDEQKRALATDLLEYVDSKHYQFLFHSAVSEGAEIAEKYILWNLIRLNLPLDDLVSQWSEELILKALPILAQSEFNKKNEFLSRIIRNRSPRVRNAGIQYIYYIQMDSSALLSLFERMDSLAKKTWLESLLTNSPTDAWRSFVASILKKGQWSSWGDEISALFVRLCFKYMGKPVLEYFSPWVSARKFVFWPKFPQERETILKVAMTQKEVSNSMELRELVRKEKSVLFQSLDLKELLKQRTGS